VIVVAPDGQRWNDRQRAIRPVPPSMRFAFGTGVVFEELAETVTAVAPFMTEPTRDRDRHGVSFARAQVWGGREIRRRRQE
jgi:hypothetical protein